MEKIDLYWTKTSFKGKKLQKIVYLANSLGAGTV